MQQITINKASQHLSDLVEAALKGEEIIIMKDNQSAVKLIPVLPVKQRRKPGSAKGMVTMSDDFDEPLEDFQEYM
ncbi:type II toxin-antitoxin system Phd/YefM family antitoxin [Richelia sinica]|nr:type II toxin-antitoxin system prevent-host-death family antitoxin [Richelia sinica]MBD2667168.1 type II toxin-antitoxin system Phd/YefM family antitoxin [Richelia sinica FACHB-800]